MKRLRTNGKERTRSTASPPEAPPTIPPLLLSGRTIFIPKTFRKSFWALQLPP
ncbi:hypothetical protein [Candidatus Ichthyocystis sparus]|uniref:hypothetical protein n=1 Tax=Candidatus Ichthyocystis sparus TaxID=1561004 RepID=UPI00159EF187|nr:hypothetical protein [Candidatus Ichthyocystis sparus]